MGACEVWSHTDQYCILVHQGGEHACARPVELDPIIRDEYHIRVESMRLAKG
jgi:hypothetical protein